MRGRANSVPQTSNDRSDFSPKHSLRRALQLYLVCMPRPGPRVPEGRTRIAQQFIVGSGYEDETSPVRDDRIQFGSPTSSFAPPGLFPICPSIPPLKTVGYCLPPLRGWRFDAVLTG